MVARLFAFILAYASVVSASEGKPSIHSWPIYTNVRFQYAICYPAGLLVPQGETVNSDGETFLGSNGEKLIVYGENTEGALSQSYNFELARIKSNFGEVTYHAFVPHGYVISARQKETILYTKTLISKGQAKTFNITYSSDVRAQFDTITRDLNICFTDLARNPIINVPR